MDVWLRNQLLSCCVLVVGTSCWYKAKETMGADPHMPELPMGFLERAQWQPTGMQAKRLVDLEWWCDQLHGAPLQPLLTSDLPRSGKANFGQNPGGIVKVGKRQHANAFNTFHHAGLMFIWTCVCVRACTCLPILQVTGLEAGTKLTA